MESAPAGTAPRAPRVAMERSLLTATATRVEKAATAQVGAS
jgi:hypothetical protein